MEKNEREFEIDTRRKRIERDEGNSVVQLRSPSFAAVHVEIAIHVAVGRRESAHSDSEMSC